MAEPSLSDAGLKMISVVFFMATADCLTFMRVESVVFCVTSEVTSSRTMSLSLGYRKDIRATATNYYYR
jgi:hypothetical protein